MSELLKLEYSAATEGLLVTLDAVNKNGHPYAGKAFPTERALLADLDPALAFRFRSLLVDLHDHFRLRVPSFTEPEHVVTRVAELARKEEELAAERIQAASEVAAKGVERDALAARIAAKNVEEKALDDAIAAKRAELASP